MKRLLILLALALPLAAQTENDTSCEIAVMPAATLLVPYFEVDLDVSPIFGRTTLFTVTNVTNEPQAVTVTVWTNLDYPLISFPVFLTGYDVQSINLYDILVRGVIAAPQGTSNAIRPGSRSRPNGANPRFLPSAATNCSRQSIPVQIPAVILDDLRSTLTTGRTSRCSEPVALPAAGGRVTGYVTIDLTATCTPRTPLDEEYWDELLYDNVLTGDWQIVTPNPTTGNYADGGPAVHIRAIPEGGPAASDTLSPFPFTFYDRLLPEGKRRTDRRQPLPTTFAARFIEGTNAAFDTQLIVWREAVATRCGSLVMNVDAPVAEIVRFDERENATVQIDQGGLPVTTSLRTAGELFPPTGSDAGGWMYLNLNNGGSLSYRTAPGTDLVSDSSTVIGSRHSQAWVVTRMAAEGRYAASMDVTPLATGCEIAPPAPNLRAPGAIVRPIAPAPPDDSCDIAQLPAATLLLPYFEVDVVSPPALASTTLFTVTNTTNEPRVARVTLWTDYAFPVLTFDVFLTGYDAQAINLRDVLVHGRLPETGSTVSPIGSRSLAGTPELRCSTLPSAIPAVILQQVREAFTIGRLTGACANEAIGGTHANAIGYATIDVVGNCSGRSPQDAGALDDLRFDNVLTGDWQQVAPNPATGNYASGSALVHIRATSGENVLPRTFYDRFYGGSRRDRRQPLPSTFAARYIQGGAGGFVTSFQIWHDATIPSGGACNTYRSNAKVRFVEPVRFDERENPTVFIESPIFDPWPERLHELPVTSRISSAASMLPPLESGDVAGWMYFNLAATAPDIRPHHGWVTTMMSAEGRYAVASDATALGNGCSPARPVSDPQNPIGPSN